MPPPKPVCVGCRKHPDDIEEYVDAANEEKAFLDDPTTAAEAASEDGTFNVRNGHFWCTECYVEAGCPLGVAP